jgi:DNA-binding MarR family transcriptional regulator
MDYVIKCPSEQDGRVIFIELTDKARQFEETFNAISTRLIENVYAGLMETEVVELEHLLEKVEQNFEEFA